MNNKIVDFKNIVIDYMKEEDIPQVMAIEVSSFYAPWTSFSFLEELKHNRLASYFSARFLEQLVGYAGVWFILDEVHITTIAVHPFYRSRGIGSLLLGKIIKLASQQRAKEVTLEVRVSNKPAQGLYTKYGFDVKGTRKNFYNDEDALIMTVTMEAGICERYNIRY